MAELLAIDRLQVAYADLQVLWDVSLTLERGQVTTLIGANGAGKTTLLKTISGLLEPLDGTVAFEGKIVNKRPPHEIAALGIAHVPEGRHLFPAMTVAENLALGAYSRATRQREAQNRERVLTLFPRLSQRLTQQAGTMSGGEQQMVAIGRALMMEPKLILLDEPSQGLQPSLVSLVFETIAEIAKTGVSIFLVEQNVHETLEISHRVYVLENGRIVRSGSPDEIFSDESLKVAYLGL